MNSSTKPGEITPQPTKDEPESQSDHIGTHNEATNLHSQARAKLYTIYVELVHV